MGTQEIQALINEAQAQLDVEQSTYDIEKQGIDKKIYNLNESIKFNRNRAASIRANGGSPQEAESLEQAVEREEQELKTQRQDMELALNRKKQRINAIKSTLESRMTSFEKAEDREKILSLVQTLVRFAS